MRNSELNKLSAIFAAADSGLFELPAEVRSARAALARLEAAVSPLPAVDSATAQAQLVAAMVDAAGTAKPRWPEPAPLMAALAAEDARRAWADARESALAVAADRIVVAVQDSADEIIGGVLRSAVKRVLAEAADVAPAFAPVAGLTDHQLLAARDEHRDAALALDRLSEAYAVLRRTQAVLSAGRVQRDVEGIWAEVDNLAELFGRRWPGRRQIAWRPGPNTARARMAWLAVGDPAEPVKPEVVTLTPGERDSRWSAAFGGRSSMQASTPGTVGLLGADGDDAF